jgi:hypothetical protein
MAQFSASGMLINPGNRLYIYAPKVTVDVPTFSSYLPCWCEDQIYSNDHSYLLLILATFFTHLKRSLNSPIPSDLQVPGH